MRSSRRTSSVSRHSCRCHLGCILLKMAAISLLTGNATLDDDPYSEDDDEDAEEAEASNGSTHYAGEYRVVATAVTRQEASRRSPVQAELPVGATIRVTNAKYLPDHSVRLCCEHGWLSVQSMSGVQLVERKPPRYLWPLSCILPSVPAMSVRTGKGLGGGVWPIAALIATEELNGVCSTKALVSMSASLSSFQAIQLASTQSVARTERPSSLS